jgi:hypothetical protein
MYHHQYSVRSIVGRVTEIGDLLWRLEELNSVYYDDES